MMPPSFDDALLGLNLPLPAPAFIATLGLQPQVITRAADRLLQLEPALDRAVIIHTSAYRPHPHWPAFADFQTYLTQRYPTIIWEWIPIAEPGQSPLEDVDTPHGAEIAFQVIYNATRALKRQGYRLHSLIAGGRKSIIVYSILTAQLLFDPNDRLWHLFSEDEYHRDLGLRPHVPDELVALVEIPVLYVSRIAPMVRELILHSDDPARAIRFYREQDDAEQLVRLQRFFDGCDPIDRQILLLRYRGLPNLDVADRVHLSDSAVTNRLKAVAERFYRDPGLGGGRYAQLPDRPHRAILIHLRPILERMSSPPA